jgi:hypothetical protein
VYSKKPNAELLLIGVIKRDNPSGKLQALVTSQNKKSMGLIDERK